MPLTPAAATAAEVAYESAVSAGCGLALRCLIVPALSLAKGIESDSVLDVDYQNKHLQNLINKTHNAIN